jgi:hypothetical protein
MVIDDPPAVESVSQLLSFIQESIRHKRHHSHIRFWFRGQSNSTWRLSPGVYRPSFNAKDEEERLVKERDLTHDFRAMAAGLLTGSNTEAELYFLQQHYRMPTRLLDWTTSPLTALYFAVSSDPGIDAALFSLDAYSLAKDRGGKYEDGRDFEGIASSRNSLFKQALYPIFRYQGNEYFPNFILPVRPHQFDRRISLQRGCFTFHPPGSGELTKDNANSLKVFLVPASAKETLRGELSTLAVDDFSIFGDLDHLASYLRYVYHC